MRLILVLLLVSAAIGCGTNFCVIGAISVSPQTATIDHTATPPGNSQLFLAFVSNAPSGCVFTTRNLENVDWTVSDPVNASITSSGQATCLNAASSPIAVRALVNSNGSTGVSAGATLICR